MEVHGVEGREKYDKEKDVRTTIIAPDFLKRINIDTKRMMPLFLQFGSLPCMELTHAESQPK